ncbi:uncharacterized protein [Setaria viridis]|uniref:uncharacterized protein n=1 Tax=Setaria viridis TaxID=4556 RepID=UPI003B3AABC5
MLDWETFCDAVFDKFDRDQYQVQLRRLDSLRQSGSVSEYLEKFEELSRGILLYNTANDDTYFVTRFLGDLKEEIRAVISLHRPKDVLTVSSLALLQEDELAASKGRGVAKDLQKQTFKPSFGIDKNKKNGLCYKCGKKWGHNHKLPPQVPLYVIEELLGCSGASVIVVQVMMNKRMMLSWQLETINLKCLQREEL